MARKSSASKQDNDVEVAPVDGMDDPSSNYVMGKIVVDDGSIEESISVLEEYTEEVDDEAESQAKTARKKLMNQDDDDDALAGNPNDTDDFTKAEKYDADEDWPLD